MTTYYKITLDGTGLSGTLCQRHVQRIRPLMDSRPGLGTTRRSEPCGALARWWRLDRDQQQVTLCTRHRRTEIAAAEALRTGASVPASRARVGRSALERYNDRIERSRVAARELAGAVELTRLLDTGS